MTNLQQQQIATAQELAKQPGAENDHYGTVLIIKLLHTESLIAAGQLNESINNRPIE